MRSSFAAKIKVGVTTCFALIILFAGTLWVKEYNPASKRIRFTVIFNNGNGIAAGDHVTVSGIKVGVVGEVSLTSDNKAGVGISLLKKIILSDDCIFTIEDVGLMGDKSLAIIPGTSSVPLDTGKEYSGSESTGFNDILSSSAQVLENLNRVAEKIDNNLDIKKLVASFKETNSKFQNALIVYEEMARENREPLKKSVANFEEATREMKTFIQKNDSRFVEVVENFQETTGKISIALDSFNNLSTAIDTVYAYFESDEGSLARFIKSDELYEEIRQTNASIDSFITDFKRNPGKYTNDMNFKIRLF